MKPQISGNIKRTNLFFVVSSNLFYFVIDLIDLRPPYK